MRENRTFKKEMGNRYLMGVALLVSVVVLLCAQKYIAAVAVTVLLAVVILQSLYIYKRFQTFLKYEEKFSDKSIREEVSCITSSDELQNLYLHYGTAENFERYFNYFEILSKYDPLYGPLDRLLSKAAYDGKFYKE